MGLPQSTYGEIEDAREMSTDVHLGFTDILPTFGAFLADQTGMGKSILVLFLIAWIVENHEYPEGENKPVLVLCHTQLVESWANDTCKKFPSLQIGIMYAGSRHIFTILLLPAEAFLVGSQNVCQNPWGCVQNG